MNKAGMKSSALGVCCFLTLAFYWASLSTANAALVTFSFTGAAGDEASFGPDAQPGSGTVSDFSRGTGLIADTAAGAFNSRSWTTATSRDLNDYYTFSISPSPGYSMSLTRLEMDERRSLTGIAQWSIYSSLDNFAAALASFTVADNDLTRVNQGVDLGAPFEGVEDAIEFRIYGFQAEGTAGTWRVDNVDLYGAITPVPEPAEWGLICASALLAIAGFHSWRNNRHARASASA